MKNKTITLSLDVIEDIVKAIENKGPNPTMHDHAIFKLKTAWPTLYKAVNQLVLSYHKNKQDELISS